MRKNIYSFYVALVLLICCSLATRAQIIIEAESGQLGDGPNGLGAIIGSDTRASGGKFVNLREGSLQLSYTITQEGFYDIYVRAAATHGQKHNFFYLNDNSTSFYFPENPDYVRLKIVNTVYLSPGVVNFSFRKDWGWIDIDYIELIEVPASERFNTNTELVTPNASREAKSLYKFLYDNYGEKIISGVMTLEPFDMSNWLKAQTGKEPALLGLDLMHCNRNYTWYNDNEPIENATTWYERNGIPIMAWHWRDPSRQTENFYRNDNDANKNTSFDITKIFEPASPEYQAMISDIDATALLLKQLTDTNVPLLWRPLHEAAGGWFWWGKDAAACKKLYQIMFDRMVNQHGLNNLIWVWTREPGDDAWYPGDEYVDIVGMDIYRKGDHSSYVLDFNISNETYDRKKIIALSECGSFPDVDNLINDKAAWSWFMPWYGEFTTSPDFNSVDLWKKMFASDYVITLDEMPDLRTYGEVISTIAGPAKSGFIIRPTLVSDYTTIESSHDPITTVRIVSAAGILADTYQYDNGPTSIMLPTAHLATGMYLVIINEKYSTRIIKN